MNSSDMSACTSTGSYWVSSTVHASIGDNTFTDAKGSVYNLLLEIHFCIFKVAGLGEQ